MPVVALPPGTKVVQGGVDRFSIVLPRRRLGKYRWAGLVPLIFGLGFGGFSYTWMSGTLHEIFHSHGAGMIFSLVFGLIGLPGLVLGLGLVILGLAVLTERTYSEIALNREFLKSIEHFGVCRWSWKRAAAGMTGISVGRGLGAESESDLGSVSIATEDGQGLTFAAGYSASLLRPIAENLAHLLEELRVARDFKPKVYDGDADEGQAADESEPSDDVAQPQSGRHGRRPTVPADSSKVVEAAMPAKTNIAILPQAHGLAIAIPACGFKGAALILTLVGALFAGVPCAMLASIVSSAGKVNLGIYLFISLFVVVGIALLLSGINAARLRFMLAVAAERVAIRRIGLFRTKEQTLTRAEIAAIHIGPSNVTVNNVPVMELKIDRAGAAATVGLLINRSADEINWIGGLLRQTLQVGTEPRLEQHAGPDAAVTQPVGSKIAIRRQGEMCAYVVPPLGMFKGAALGALVFSIFWLGMVAFMMTMVVRRHESIGILLFLGIFLAVGLAMLAYAIKSGRQRVLLVVTPELLAYERSSPFGTSKRQFQRSEITAIGIGPSGASVNNKPIPELKVEIKKRGSIGLLQGHSSAELAWMAASLRSNLRVGTIAGD